MPTSAITRLYKRDKGICHYCLSKTVRKKGSTGKHSPLDATKEHVVPKSLGGPGIMENYVLACSACNNRRGVILFFCRCSSCTDKIYKWLDQQGNVDKMFWSIVEFNKPRVVQDRDGRWRVKRPGVNFRFDTWREAMDFVFIEYSLMMEI